MPDRYTVGYFYLCDKFRGYNKDKEGAAACRGKGKNFKSESDAFVAYGRYNVRLYIRGGRVG